MGSDPLRFGVWLVAIVLLVSVGDRLSAQSVTDLVLIDAVSDTEIGALTDGAILDLGALPTSQLNVRADVSGTVGSVRFGLDGDANYSTESVPPYALAGDTNADYNPWTPAAGIHTITATPFTGSGASGTAGGTLTITFDVVVGVPGGDQAPVVSAGPDRFVSSPGSSVTVTGAARDPDGVIVSVGWTQLAGPPVTIATPAALSTDVTGLPVDAVIVLELAATDDTGDVGRDTVLVARIPATTPSAAVEGEFREWHRITLDFAGPSSSESAALNPFLDYRLEVSFTHDGRSILVPGFFAASGDAAESGASAGNVWRVHFTPDATGVWEYTALFRSGSAIAIADDGTGGTGDLSIHGAQGSFTVAETDKSPPDFRGEGLLRYVGKHHLEFAGSGRPFLKGGADSPENFLAYVGFDGTFDNNGNFLHSYLPHAGDWQAGDPEWDGGRGRTIIGALNYLASMEMNSVYFLTMNVGGDGNDVWPWTAPTERVRFDVSKLDQWEIVFSHMDSLGLQLHVITQETENDQLLDGGALGPERKLYLRELVARFSHHLAITWNLGEENTNSNAERRAFARWIRGLDPYDHPIVIHTFPGSQGSVYNPLLGFDALEGPSLQQGLSSVHGNTLQWINASAAAGRPWVVCNDENGPANFGVVPDADDFTHDSVRKQALWGNLMAGGAGCEWYFGYSFAHDDLDCEDWRSRDQMWTQTAHALRFFRDHLPIGEMVSADGLVSLGNAHCLAQGESLYAVYLPSGGVTNLLVGAGEYEVRWYDPRNGGALQVGSVVTVNGPGNVSLGSTPDQPGEDWAILIRAAAAEFIRGDCNGTTDVNIADPIFLLGVLFGGGSLPDCPDACDANDDGVLDLSDPISTLVALFSGGTLPAPTGACGLDPTADALDCGGGAACP